ncbi:hypothetical protein [Aquimarina sp. SS2-1]|uniref:hypothetical protein n=1 Tax=Aquimarina besae TaxID=3342247 RepID=UPI003671B98C
MKNIKVLSKKQQASVKGEYDWEGRRQSCNVTFHSSLGFAAVHYANEAASRCGGSYLDYYVI